jgi:hypothetical protein
MKLIYHLTLYLTLGSFINNLYSQEDFIYENQVWVGYITSARVSDRISIWNDAHFVPESFLILRTGATYHFNFSEKVKGSSTLGFARLWLYSRNDLTPTRNEFRPWGQTTAAFNIKKFTISNRLRYDARFRQEVEDNILLDTYQFNWRLRYFLMIKYPIAINNEKSTEWYSYAYNEILYDLGKNVTNGFRLNQNRFTIGIGYKFDNMRIQLGYLNMIKNPSTDGNKIFANTAMLMVFHNFDLRTKK